MILYHSKKSSSTIVRPVIAIAPSARESIEFEIDGYAKVDLGLDTAGQSYQGKPLFGLRRAAAPGRVLSIV